MSLRNILLGLGLAALAAGCAHDRDRLREFEEALVIASSRPAILTVDVALRTPPKDSGGAPLELVIERVATAPGALPRLDDDPRLQGLLELLDRRGRTVWSMRYQPLERPDGRLRLRAPRLSGTRSVRVSEPQRKLRAEAPLGG